MTMGQGVEFGPFSFTVIRILIAIGVARVIFRGERLKGGFNNLDWTMVFWALWALTSSIFYKDSTGALIFRMGLVYNTCGVYFLFRILCQSFEDAIQLCCITAILLAPVALEMIFEKFSHRNLFSVFGGVSEFSGVREGRLRAQGPFRHPILAGTVGAVCIPLMAGLWHTHRRHAILGGVSCLAIILSSASSGPVLSALVAAGALILWPFRNRIKPLLWLAVLGYIALDVVMKAPAYYLMGRIDVAGGSGGWHRARLIEMAISHIGEWWLAGTDYTRHWMPTGVSWNPDHTDITNHYIKMGVLGGLPLMLLFMTTLAYGFWSILAKLQKDDQLKFDSKFFLWALWASLFANAATCISVSYFDQSFVFLYLTLAVIGSLGLVKAEAEAPRKKRLLIRGVRRTRGVDDPPGTGSQDEPAAQPVRAVSRFGLRLKPKAVKTRNSIRQR